MPVYKRVLCTQRLRQVPRQFSWIDHRLVRDRHISRCSANALALYLFLVAVCDGQGLSYYADKTICRLLPLDPGTLGSARAELIANRLIAWQPPLYQVLALGAAPRSGSAQATVPPAASTPAVLPARHPPHQRQSLAPSTSSRQASEAQSFGDILRQLTNPVQSEKDHD
jgi:hypothetical protein